MLAPFVVVERGQAVSAIVVYLVLYAATNLGAFAVVIAASRTTRSGEISSYAGLFRTAPGLAVAMTVFLASFVGIPPVGAWYGKFGVMRVLMAAPGKYPLVLAIILAINTAIAAYYYLNVAKTMWFDEPTAGATTGVKVPTSLKIALTLTLTATMVLGVFPGIIDDAANYVPESAVTANP
jgi:NADH-quinone oxidoreductase subunit N